MARVLSILAVALARALPLVAGADAGSIEDGRPIAMAAADVYEGAAPLRVCFDASESRHPRGEALVFTWDFGDGRGTASEPTACHLYVEVGLYAAMVRVTDDHGLEGSRVVIVWAYEDR